MKLLYDSNAETRPFAKAQGAVLLTHHTSAEYPRAGGWWLTRAIENATIACAQPSCAENVKRSLKKRLWWSILLRDRSLCIGLRRQPQLISVDRSELSGWLSEEDFAGGAMVPGLQPRGQTASTPCAQQTVSTGRSPHGRRGVHVCPADCAPCLS